MRRLRSLAPWLLLATLAGSAGVRAQSPESSIPPRPYRGLFGGDEEGTIRQQSLDLSASTFGGYESNVALAQSALFGGGGPPTTPALIGAAGSNTDKASEIFGMSTTLSYVRRWQRASFNSYGSATSSQYPSVSKEFQTGYAGGVGFDVPLSRRVSLQARAAVTRSPYYELGSVFPPLPSIAQVDVPVSVPTLELGLIPASALHAMTDVRVSRDFTRRNRLDVFVSRVSTSFDNGTFAGFNTSDSRGGIEFNRTLSRYATLRLGYDYRVGQLGNRAEQRFQSNEINAGVDYHRAFNVWRRTTFSFTTGSTVMANQPLELLRVPPPPTSPELRTDSLLATDQGASTDLRVILTGTASFVWEFFRTWSARAEYVRGVSYLEGFAAPALANAVTAGFSGLVARRFQTGAGVSYSAGSIGTRHVGDNGYGSWNAYASANYAVSRHLAAYAQYFYYNYGFQPGVVLPPGLKSDFHRNGVRVGLKTWVPLCHCR